MFLEQATHLPLALDIFGACSSQASSRLHEEFRRRMTRQGSLPEFG
jgi:hypothetical protein